ncbi:MAG: [Clostridia bacterium]|nr:[FeFe] hydrogenase H-cluster maturation GTPase HydF [Clostridia bacterium]
MSMNELHSSERVHIVFVGKRNSGKSSLINAITGQDISIVSNTPGTTTDAVKKVMEITGLGPCVVVDTAGFDDIGDLGAMRVEKTHTAVRSADVVLVVVSAENDDYSDEINFAKSLNCENIIYVINKTDLAKVDLEKLPEPKIAVSALTGEGLSELIELIKKYSPEKIAEPTITGNLVKNGDTVLLVMPQDDSAPKGRLILPQVQVIRELLDKGANPICATLESLPTAMDTLKGAPDLVITDSQVFGKVADIIPADWRLTSFSVLLAGYKGDIGAFVAAAKTIDKLKAGSRVLIAEACSHTTTDADIARVKIPSLLHKKVNPDIEITVASGNDFPEDVSGYDLVIHCGACMFNRAHVMARNEICRRSGVPMTNYGVAIAHLTGILDRVVI